MAANPATNLDDTRLVAAARGGDERAFVELTSAHRSALHTHCYRLLGSLHDADDALQETLLRAWRGIDRFETRAPIAAWLYRIATNVCLRMLEQRGRREAASIDAHLQPYPEPTAAEGCEPEVAAESREAVGLAFVAAMQLLPPKQRAVLVLRDVLDWSAREVAEFLHDTVPAVNSALQRARDRVAREHAEGTLARVHRPASAEVEARVMRRFQDAWEAVDIDGIVALLATDALMTMPPESARVESGAAVAAFFATVPLEGRLEEIRLRSASGERPARARGVRTRRCHRRPRGLWRDGLRHRRRPDRRHHRLSAPARTVPAAGAPCHHLRLMAFDEHLADRIREALRDVPDVREQRMFGGLAFLVSGKMACGIVGDELMLRLGEHRADAALDEPHVRPMDFTGRPMRTMVYVAPAGFATPNALRRWVDQGVAHAATLPPKARRR